MPSWLRVTSLLPDMFEEICNSRKAPSAVGLLTSSDANCSQEEPHADEEANDFATPVLAAQLPALSPPGS